jgi:hypothetical protein
VQVLLEPRGTLASLEALETLVSQVSHFIAAQAANDTVAPTPMLCSRAESML